MLFQAVIKYLSSSNFLKFCLKGLRSINVNNYNIPCCKDGKFYFNMLLATYITSGISLQNLMDDNTPNVIKSIAHFHVYYTIARFMKNPTLMQEYITPEVIKAVRSHIPIKYKDFESQTTDGDGNYFIISCCELQFSGLQGV